MPRPREGFWPMCFRGASKSDSASADTFIFRLHISALLIVIWDLKRHKLHDISAHTHRVIIICTVWKKKRRSIGAKRIYFLPFL